jgi:S1-C subfamily serine protease
VGGLLSVALLWAMLPSAGAPAPQAVQSTQLDTAGSPQPTVSASSVLRGTISAPVVTDRSTSIDTTAKSTTSLAPQVTQRPAQSSVDTVVTSVPEPGGVPAAVAFGGADFAITTASAATSQTTIAVALLDGPTVTVEVVLVDAVTGLAVVDLPDDIAVEPRTTSAGHDGELVSILGSTPVGAVLTMSSSSLMMVDVDTSITVTEAAPIVNSAGQLIGLCTWNAGAATVVSLDAADSLRLAAEAMQPDPWLGIKLSGDPTTPLVVADVVPEGPAATAGIAAGDTIVAAGGTPITLAGQLKEALAAFSPGDTMIIDVRRADGTSSSISVLVGSSPDGY